MSSQHDSALMRKQFYSLSADTLIILARASLGHSDEEIITWSAGWNFTKETIQRSFAEASGVFGFDAFTDARGVVLSYVRLCRDIGLMGPLTARGIPPEEIAKTHSTKQERPSMGQSTEEYPIHTRVQHLDKLEQRILAELAKDASDDAIKRKLSMSQELLDERIGQILKFLKIDEHQTHQRRKALAVSAYTQNQQSQKKAPTSSQLEKHDAVTAASPAAVHASALPHKKRVPSGVCEYNGIDINSAAFKRVLGGNIKNVGLALHLKVSAIALSLGKSPQYLYSFSQGAGSLDVKALESIAAVLHVDSKFLATMQALSLQDVFEERRRAELESGAASTAAPELASPREEAPGPRVTARQLKVVSQELMSIMGRLIESPEFSQLLADIIKAWVAVPPKEKKMILELLDSMNKE